MGREEERKRKSKRKENAGDEVMKWKGDYQREKTRERGKGKRGREGENKKRERGRNWRSITRGGMHRVGEKEPFFLRRTGTGPHSSALP